VLFDQFKKDGVEIAALDNVPGAISINEFDRPQKLALILGNETEGIEEDVIKKVSQVIYIPMPGIKRSLNVSVATGIALFALVVPTPVQ